MNKLPVGYSVRLAVIRSVSIDSVTCSFMDTLDEKPFACPKPHPYAGSGTGIFVGFERDTLVLVASGPYEQKFIVGIVGNKNFYYDQEGIPNSPITFSKYPDLSAGELSFKNSVGSKINLELSGNIKIDAGIGDDSADLELSNKTRGLYFRVDNIYQFTESGRSVNGIIKRDFHKKNDVADTNTINFLSSEEYDRLLDPVGRIPQIHVNKRNSVIMRDDMRNPALVENRSITYEYANSFGVKGLAKESVASNKIDSKHIGDTNSNIQINDLLREDKRTDILDLNPRNFNHLIEKVEGTVVDIYGNILDINRNPINIAPADKNKLDLNALLNIYSFLRRSVKFHFEINSRKPEPTDDPQTNPPLTLPYYLNEHSRWSIDVDGEGLTKINIPSSSETGNIPVLSRHVVSRGPDKTKDGSFIDPNKKDVYLLPFGNGSGPTIKSSDYSMQISPEAKLTKFISSMAHHNILTTAQSITRYGKLKNIDADFNKSEYKLAVSDLICNSLTGDKANAGGRSLHANLDGSIELSVGADTVDRKSLSLDTAGGIVSHIGRDLNGRSIIQQTDGDIIIEIGGSGISTDKRFQSDSDVANRPGRVEIHLNRVGSDPQKIIIDENGITIDIQGNSVLRSTGDMSIISTSGNLLLSGERVCVYGDIDANNRTILAPERLIGRSGTHI